MAGFCFGLFIMLFKGQIGGLKLFIAFFLFVFKWKFSVIA